MQAGLTHHLARQRGPPLAAMNKYTIHQTLGPDQL